MLVAVADPASVEQVVGRLAPEGAAVAACRVHPSLEEDLTDQERALVATARPARRSEFAAGRACAHRALVEIGAPAPSIACGRRRQPLWPTGVTGSISHADGLAVAVAARTRPGIASLGVDLEVAARLEDELWPHVLTRSERDACAASTDPTSAARVFSAKEAVFKALYPVLGAEIDFLEAHAELGRHGGQVAVPHLGVTAAVDHDRIGPLVVSVAVLATDP